MDVPSQVTPEIMRRLTAELPLNDFGLPTGIYRSDLLPLHLYVEPGLGQSGTQLLEDQSGDLARRNPDLPEPSEDQADPTSLSLSENASDETPIEPAGSIDPLLILQGGIFPSGDGEPGSKRRQDVALSQPKAVTNGEYTIAGFPWGPLQKAFVPLHYDEGFPSFDNGAAFWDKMPFEPMEAYQAFQRYCQMARGRSPNYEDDEDYGEPASGTRSISILVSRMYPNADDTLILSTIDRFKEYSHLYYWGQRVRSYDLFRIAQFRQQQELRAIETQDDHYIQARKLRHRLAQYMESEEEFWDLMTPKVAMDMLKQLTTLERISAGVPATGPQTESESRGQSFEVALKTVAQTHSGQKRNTFDEDGNVLDSALDDPAATEILQQLIIKTGGGS